MACVSIEARNRLHIVYILHGNTIPKVDKLRNRKHDYTRTQLRRKVISAKGVFAEYV